MALEEQDREYVKLIVANAVNKIKDELKACMKEAVGDAVTSHEKSCPHKAAIAKGKAFFAGMMTAAGVVGGMIVLVVKKVMG